MRPSAYWLGSREIDAEAVELMIEVLNFGGMIRTLTVGGEDYVSCSVCGSSCPTKMPMRHREGCVVSKVEDYVSSMRTQEA